MKTVTTRPSFQGDLMIRRIDAPPSNSDLALVAPEAGNLVIAHSETGHHHVVEERAARLLIDKTNAFIGYLEVLSPTELRHLRDFDTHEPYALQPGWHEVRRQREATPDGWRRASD